MHMPHTLMLIILAIPCISHAQIFTPWCENARKAVKVLDQCQDAMTCSAACKKIQQCPFGVKTVIINYSHKFSESINGINPDVTGCVLDGDEDEAKYHNKYQSFVQKQVNLYKGTSSLIQEDISIDCKE